MMKTALIVAAAVSVLATAPLTTSANAQGVDVRIGRDRYDRYDDRRDYRLGVGPGGLSAGPGRRCRTVTTTVERGNRTITRRERRCD